MQLVEAAFLYVYLKRFRLGTYTIDYNSFFKKRKQKNIKKILAIMLLFC